MAHPIAWTLRDLRFLDAAARTGSFTDAAAELFVSQAAVSRTIAGLERNVGERLLVRTPRGCELTGTGRQVLQRAVPLLAQATRFDEFLAGRTSVLRLGYSWAGLGDLGRPLVRRWEADHPRVRLQFVRDEGASAGLAEGRSDVAIVRTRIDDKRFESAMVGLEERVVAFAADDPRWARRRTFRMAEVAQRTILVDPHTGTTSTALWPGREGELRTLTTRNVDDWLDTIEAGRGVGITSRATAAHHVRPGVVFRTIKDAPPIEVRLAWWRGQPPPMLTELVESASQLFSARR